MKFGNVNTGQIVDVLPTTLELEGKTITGATFEHYITLGWRLVTQIDEPPVGFRVISYNVVQLDGTTCKLTVNETSDIAAEEAANLAAIKAEAKAIFTSNDILARAVRAMAELTLQEINVLRQKAALTQYTEQQFQTALLNKIDAQS